MVTHLQSVGAAPPTCGCAMRADGFLRLLTAFDRQRTRPWTHVAPLTHPLHWTCGAELFQRALDLHPREAAPTTDPTHEDAVALRVRKPRAEEGDGPGVEAPTRRDPGSAPLRSTKV